MMYANPYGAVTAQAGMPVTGVQNPAQASGYLSGMAQGQDQQQIMAAYALQQQQYMLAQQQAQAQATAGQTATGQVAANPYAGYATNTAALQQY